MRKWRFLWMTGLVLLCKTNERRVGRKEQWLTHWPSSIWCSRLVSEVETCESPVAALRHSAKWAKRCPECWLLPLSASPRQHQPYLPAKGKSRHDPRHGHTHTEWSVAMETVVFLQQRSFPNRAARTAATAGRIHLQPWTEVSADASGDSARRSEIKFRRGINIWKPLTRWNAGKLSEVISLFPVVTNII